MHWDLNKMADILQATFSNDFFLAKKFSCFTLGEFSITWTNVDQDLWCHITSPSDNELKEVNSRVCNELGLVWKNIGTRIP